MSSENTKTGRLGKFVVESTQVARTKKWAVSRTLASKSEWGDSDSGGFTNRAAGRKDATFDAEGVYATNAEQFDLFKPEDIAKAVLWMDNLTLYWVFPRALCLDFKMEVDIDGETVIGWNSSWGADGIYYAPGEDNAPTETLP